MLRVDSLQDSPLILGCSYSSSLQAAATALKHMLNIKSFFYVILGRCSASLSQRYGVDMWSQDRYLLISQPR
ncbi:hypothetical protein SERLADRAFT_476196 [Serpula lacrymans var. lacrymans S7.9]|uniref:Uncharacterized protein n=1 Tax=Serpula lacrymans var. lacrymans (strain S7.9) TaxID=578457 RepID=F8P733_SERL9|nr:uncharacterized protein SERLADRAFT_476196 [Serpula lacrymans var. lacrymans S7.9]EGO21249.1 hypothetical protein SERLADRAFT_476196 [Serpula lacrymans var. lacrymans S7.9]